MKVLGFILEERPSVGAHVQYSINKFNKSLWAVTHLKRANIENNVLLKVYTVMLRPHLEYGSPVFHPMLTEKMSEDLERQQRRALKIIYGFGESYSCLLNKTGLKTLRLRREEACKNFAKKLLESTRFNYLFPENEYEEEAVVLRKTKKYKEEYAKTNRLYNSPLFYMRRELNNEL